MLIRQQMAILKYQEIPQDRRSSLRQELTLTLTISTLKRPKWL